MNRKIWLGLAVVIVAFQAMLIQNRLDVPQKVEYLRYAGDRFRIDRFRRLGRPTGAERDQAEGQPDQEADDGLDPSVTVRVLVRVPGSFGRSTERQEADGIRTGLCCYDDPVRQRLAD